jgi:hypothetical protein
LSVLTRKLQFNTASERLEDWSARIHQTAAELFPADPRLQGEFLWDTVPQVIGSLAFFAATAKVGGWVGAPLGLARLGSTTAALPVAGLLGVAETTQRLAPYVAEGVLDQDTADTWALSRGSVAGIIQVVPILHWMRKGMGHQAADLATKAFNERLKTVTRDTIGLVWQEATVEVLVLESKTGSNEKPRGRM